MPDAEQKRRRRRRPPTEDDPIAAVVDRVLDSRQASMVLDAFGRLLDRAGNAIDPRYREVQAPPQPPPPQPRRAAPRETKEAVARSILHFAAGESLDKIKITKRRQQLAKLCHPDVGGSAESMVKINQAADVLLLLVAK